MLSMRKILTPLAIALGFVCNPLLAATSADNVARLDSAELTPVGAERAANADGRIPAWDGGITTPPENYKAGGRLSDPFADEKPLFNITAANLDQYQQHLSPGQVAMLKRYPETFRMPVYPSHRSAAYPQAVYDAIKAQAGTVEMIQGGNGLKNMEASTVPFPIPENGMEVVWNHIVRYRGNGSILRKYTQIPVQTSGNFSPVLFEEQASWARDMPDNDNPNRLFAFIQKVLAPARLEGDILLVHENIDQVAEPRAAWLYNPGQRRVRRAPEVAYDGPGTASDGLRTFDDLDLFNGAPDRYDWKLVGKREMYIPYNAYQLRNGELSYKDIIQPGHMNPEYLRYELHRVWVVDATLKDGARHIYARRTFYVDEDSWQIALVDHYDGRGELWRFKEGHAIVHYQVNVPWLAVESLHDLLSGRYLTIGLDNELKGYQYEFNYGKASWSDYTPAALRRSAKR